MSANDPDSQPPVLALSTMWSQGRYLKSEKDHNMTAFAEAVSALGYPNIEINYVVPPDGLESLLSTNHVGVASLHSPTPRITVRNGLNSEDLNLASLDEEERRMAVRLACVTIDHAAGAGARYIVVHLGGVGSKTFEEERSLRRLYDSGARDGDEAEALRRQALVRRREGARTHLPEARRSLAEIADHAAAHSVTIGLENRFHYHEFPSVDEMHELLADYPPHVAGFWLDIGHAEVLDRLGLIPRHRWLDELADRCVGSHVHDVEGLADHRAPGHGTADWDHYVAKLPPRVPRVLEINQHIPEDHVREAIPFLRRNGMLPA